MKRKLTALTSIKLKCARDTTVPLLMIFFTLHLLQITKYLDIIYLYCPCYFYLCSFNCEDCRLCDHKVMVSRVRNEEMMNVTRSSEQVIAGDDPVFTGVWWMRLMINKCSCILPVIIPLGKNIFLRARGEQAQRDCLSQFWLFNVIWDITISPIMMS